MKIISCFLVLLIPLFADAQTPVLFPLAQMTGTTNDTIITIKPVINPVKFNSLVYWLPTTGIQLKTVNGSATTNLIPNDYNVVIAGVPGSWKISVSDTNVTLNAAEIGNLTTYNFTDPANGVQQIIPGTGISISPANGKGNVTVTATGSSGGGSATNVYRSQAGNNLISISTNLTDLVYTFSGVSQTNGFPWGALYDAVGQATAATNGWPWGSHYDASGSATAATNGISLASGLSAFRSTNSFDAVGSATAATNGYPWGALYDALNAALNSTNGLGLPSGLAAFRSTNTFASTNVATASTVGLIRVDNSTITVASDGTISATTGGGGDFTGPGSSTAHHFLSFANSSGKLGEDSGKDASDFDAAGTATAATNDLHTTVKSEIAAGDNAIYDDAVHDSTNGYPWGVLYDAAGQATAATNGWPWGSLYDASGAAALRLATNDTRVLTLTNQSNAVHGSLWGTIHETNTVAGNGIHGLVIGENTDNSFLTGGSAGAEVLQQRLAKAGWWGLDANNIGFLWKVGASEGSSLDMAWNFFNTLTTTYSDSAHLVKGAPQTLSVPYIGGSASSLIDLPTHGPEIWAAKKHPWIGISTVAQSETIANWRSFQTIYTNLPAVCQWFSSTGIVSALAPYGIQLGVWGDTGAFTNRTTGGALQLDPWILTSASIADASNYVYAVHTNGFKISLANYRSTRVKNPWNGDTQRVQTNGTSHDISYPSGLGTWTGATWAVITPETSGKDMQWYYSNRVDEIFLQNVDEFEMWQGYEQQVLKFANSCLYVGDGWNLYWADSASLTGQNPISSSPGAFPRTSPAITNQMILGWFADFPSSQLQYSINDITPNQTFAVVGSEGGLAQAMSFARTYHESMSNWDNPVFPNFPANDPALTKTAITNTLCVGEMFRGNIYFAVNTSWTWNTNIQQVLTNAPLFLSTWNDNALKWPTRMFDDGTNSLWLRPIDNAAFLVLAANQSAGSSNFNSSLIGYPKGLATNAIYNVTNVLTGDAFGTGYLTNNFIGTLAAGNCAYVRLTPYSNNRPVLDLGASTNTVAWTHLGTATNLTATFNGTLQSFTVTNGPTIFFSYLGANGSCSYRFTTNVTLSFSYQPKWLAGSNNVITNGVLSLTSYGGTNAMQIEAAIIENQ